MAKKSISINPEMMKSSLAKAVRPIAQHSTVIMVVTAVGILIYSIMSVSGIITVQDDINYRSEQSANRISSGFDEETIEKINNLNASSDTSAIELPKGRRNPFIN